MVNQYVVSFIAKYIIFIFYQSLFQNLSYFHLSKWVKSVFLLSPEYIFIRPFTKAQNANTFATLEEGGKSTLKTEKGKPNSPEGKKPQT